MKTLLSLMVLIIALSDSLAQSDDFKCGENSVSNIKLRNPASVEKVLGKGINYLNEDDDETEVINSDGKQLLTMIFNPGGTINEFSSFRVEYNSENLQLNLKVKKREFVTGKDVRLGLTEDQVENKLGTPTNRSSNNGLTIWRYECEDDLYFGHYDFLDGRLVRFWFGFEYP